MSNADLRFRARQTLGGKLLEDKWMYPLLVLVLASIVSSILTSFVLGIVLIGFITYGTSKYFLYLSRGMIAHNNLMILTDGVKGDVIGNMLVELLRSIFTFLWSLLFIIPGIIKAYSYSMAYYIKIDHPEYTATQAIDESRALMDGNKMKLFMLDLSFIGWILLGALCFGIGMLWVNPYIQCSHAEFYRDLVGG